MGRDGPYQVKLGVFEGPLDLLLFLVRKDEVNIYDIPIAEITQEYLEYIALMQQLDLDVAGEFILMAATLMRIKVQMMLPTSSSEEEEAEDPRTELVRSLLDYQRYKEAAQEMGTIEIRERKRFARAMLEPLEKDTTPEPLVPGDVQLIDLMSALHHVIAEMPRQEYRTIQREEFNLDERIDFILSLLTRQPRLSFADLLRQAQQRLLMIVTFLAVLELAKRQAIQLRQDAPFADIWILKAA